MGIKWDQSNIKNIFFRPICPLFIGIAQKQLNNHINKFISPFLCCLQKRLQYSIYMDDFNQKWKICIDQKRNTKQCWWNYQKHFM